LVALTEPQVHLWTYEEYIKLLEAGLFEGKRVELIGGQIFEMPAMKEPHATALKLPEKRLEILFGEGYFARVQSPLLTNGTVGAPEPDIAIVRGHPRDYVKEHPRSAALVVEIADTSLEHDRTIKLVEYAKAGIADHWILNLNTRQLEVYHMSSSGDQYRNQYGYSSMTVLHENELVPPLAFPQNALQVSELLP
jgi:Uma2 family endonuclease